MRRNTPPLNSRRDRLIVFKRRLLKVLPTETPADFDLLTVSSKEMESIRQSLLKRKDFKGPEARKIASEEIVDVLSFPEPKGFPHPESRNRYLGEVYLNLSVGASSVAGEVRLKMLMVHGVLHLLGYRHTLVRDTIKMEALEKKICRELNIGI